MSEPVTRTYRSIRGSMLNRHFVRKLTNRTDSLLRNRAIDAYNVVSIDPHCIKYIQTLPNGHPDEYLRGRFDKYQSYHLRGGDWDQHVFPIEETTFYRAYINGLLRGVSGNGPVFTRISTIPTIRNPVIAILRYRDRISGVCGKD